MLMTWSKVRHSFCNFVYDFGLLGVILELRGDLIQDKMPKGRKSVAKGCQNGGSEAPLGATWGSIKVHREAFGHPVGDFGILLALLYGLCADFFKKRQTL